MAKKRQNLPNVSTKFSLKKVLEASLIDQAQERYCIINSKNTEKEQEQEQQLSNS